MDKEINRIAKIIFEKQPFLALSRENAFDIAKAIYAQKQNIIYEYKAELLEVLEKIKNGDYDNAHSPKGASLLAEQALNRYKEKIRKNA